MRWLAVVALLMLAGCENGCQYFERVHARQQQVIAECGRTKGCVVDLYQLKVLRDLREKVERCRSRD
jgi:uncharacterized lipoprotein YmbA